MGLFVKTVHGDKYLYVLVGKKQFFLGRKDMQDDLNLDNLLKAMSKADAILDKRLKKYVETTREYASYLPKDQRDAYIRKRKSSLLSIASRIS